MAPQQLALLGYILPENSGCFYKKSLVVVATASS